MKSLALRIYLAVVAVLLVFALVTGWLAQRNAEHERQEAQSQAASSERAAAWGELIDNSLPPVSASQEEQARVFLDWADRLRLPMALDNVAGQRIATSEVMERLLSRPEFSGSMQKTRLSDGRTLWMMRPPRLLHRGVIDRMNGPGGPGGPGGLGGLGGLAGPGGPGGPGAHAGPGPDRAGDVRDQTRPWTSALFAFVPPWVADGVPALAISLVMLFVAVAIGAWPVATRLTRRLKALRDGVEAFGAGQLQLRVQVEGRDEVAELASSFNQTAQRIEDLVTANRSLLANASHELRSPLARLKMAVSIMGDMPPERAAQLKDEIHQDIRELDSLVEEVLLASRLDARSKLDPQPVDLLGLATEEALRVSADVRATDAPTQPYLGDDRLLRRAVRNLLENARRYGGPDIVLELVSGPSGVQITVGDRGPGVPLDQRERIFEPFYRMPGHAEHAGGVGLGLSLVRQIAEGHGGKVRCEARDGGGSLFVIALPPQTA
jgi:signal transduction histidine kinase